MMPEGTPEAIHEALRVLEDIVQFAYKHGYHEVGYDPVARVRDHVKEQEDNLYSAWESAMGEDL